MRLVFAALLIGAAVLASQADAASPFPVPAGQSFHDRDWSPEIVVIPAGTFMMGSTEDETTREQRAPNVAAFERPRHEVKVDQPLGVGKYLVTLGDFKRFVAATGRAMTGGCMVVENAKWGLNLAKSYADTGYPQTDRSPVACVTWQDADDYAAWLSKETGHHYRLLREAEFEYATRAGTTTARWWGDAPTNLCQHVNGADLSFDKIIPGDPQTNRRCDDGYGFVNPVGAFPPNPFGLYDMIGNLWEWTSDCFVGNYEHAPMIASAEISGGDCQHRSIRGGSWHNYPNVLRAANRFNLPVDMRSISLGFRIARLPD